jgi:hypothetical protein
MTARVVSEANCTYHRRTHASSIGFRGRMEKELAWEFSVHPLLAAYEKAFQQGPRQTQFAA